MKEKSPSDPDGGPRVLTVSITLAPASVGILLACEKCSAAQPGKDDQSETSSGCDTPNDIARDTAQYQGNECNDKQQCTDINVELNDQTMRPDPAPCISTRKVARKLHLKIRDHP